MFNTMILDVAIGMIFIYLLLSLMCSAANEIIELLLKKRAIDLEKGIREMLDPTGAPSDNDIVQNLYNHPLINGLFEGTYEGSRIKNVTNWIVRTHLPSYIPSRNFALAMMDLLVPGGGTPNQKSGAAGATVDLPKPANPPQTVVNVGGVATPSNIPHEAAVPSAAVAALLAALNDSARRTDSPNANFKVSDKVINPTSETPDPQGPKAKPSSETPKADVAMIPDQMRKALIPLIDAAGGDITRVRENIEAWFDASMQRVSGWYKRRAQVTLMFLGLFIAITLNVDTITVVKRLSTDRALRDSLVAAADAYSKANAELKPSPSPSPSSSPSSSPSPSPSSSPSPTPSPSPSPAATGAAVPQVSSTQTATNPADNPTGAAQGVTTAGTSSLPVTTQVGASSPIPAASPSASPALPAACVEDKESEDCKLAIKLQVACKASTSAECKRLTDLNNAVVEACKDPNQKSADCGFATASQKACDDPSSDLCRLAGNVQKACKGDLKDSPNCKYLTNQQQLLALGLPIGWDDKNDPKRNFAGWSWSGTNGGWSSQLYWHWLGWLLTALAISLGAPFWFDLLAKFMAVRSAVKPKEKSSNGA